MHDSTPTIVGGDDYTIDEGGDLVVIYVPYLPSVLRDIVLDYRLVIMLLARHWCGYNNYPGGGYMRAGPPSTWSHAERWQLRLVFEFMEDYLEATVRSPDYRRFANAFRDLGPLFGDEPWGWFCRCLIDHLEEIRYCLHRWPPGHGVRQRPFWLLSHHRGSFQRRYGLFVDNEFEVAEEFLDSFYSLAHLSYRLS